MPLSGRPSFHVENARSPPMAHCDSIQWLTPVHSKVSTPTSASTCSCLGSEHRDTPIRNEPHSRKLVSPGQCPGPRAVALYDSLRFTFIPLPGSIGASPVSETPVAEERRPRAVHYA